MKTIVTETALKTKFWSAAIRTVANFLISRERFYRTAAMPYLKCDSKEMKIFTKSIRFLIICPPAML